MLHSLCQQIWKTQQWPQDWKRSVFIPIPKIGNERNERKVMLKNVQITIQFHSFYMPARLCSHSKLGFSSMWPKNFRCTSWIKERQRRQRTNCQHQLDHRKKQGNSRKTSISASLTMLKPLTVWIITNCGIFLLRQEYQTTWPASWETCMQDKKLQLELDMEQQTSSKLGKEYIKVVYCHVAYITYMLI